MITADEFRARAQHSSTADDRRLEQHIDDAIAFATINSDRPIRVSTAGYGAGAVQRVTSRFALAGWQVTTRYDSRDGDFVELELP